MMRMATIIFKYGVMNMSHQLDADSAAFSAMDRQSVLHPFVRLDEYARGISPDPLVVDRAEGLWV